DIRRLHHLSASPPIELLRPFGPRHPTSDACIPSTEQSLAHLSRRCEEAQGFRREPKAQLARSFVLQGPRPDRQLALGQRQLVFQLPPSSTHSRSGEIQ